MLAEIRVLNMWREAQLAQVTDHEARLRQMGDRIPAQLDSRLTTVERWQWRAAGFAAALGAVAGIVAAIVVNLLGRAH